MRFGTVFALGLLVAACGSGEPPTLPPEAALSAPASRDTTAATAAAHAHDAPSATPLVEPGPAVPVIEQQVAYGEADARNLVGYLAMPRDAAEPLPGVIVIHEWWGLNDNIKAVARRLAGEGYVALAVDLYDGEVAAAPAGAEALMARLAAAPDAVRRNLRQAYTYLETHAFAPRIGSIGWCLGGGWALETALLLPGELDAVVMLYGEVVNDRRRLAALDTPLLGIFAERDAVVPVADVQRFDALLADLGKQADVRIYPGVAHAFANPSGGNYDAQAAQSAWEAALAFLEANLQDEER